MREDASTVYSRYTVAERNADREASDEFQRLPLVAQRELRAKWQAEFERQIVREEDRYRFLWRAVREGAAAFALSQLIFFPFSIGVFLLAAGLGAVTGLGWWAVRAGRFLCIVIAVPGFALLVLASSKGFAIIFGAVFCLSACAVLGAMREFRPGDGGAM